MRLSCNSNTSKRYNRETLEVQFKQKSIADVLDITVEEGIQLFSAVPVIRLDPEGGDAGGEKACPRPRT